MFSRMAKGIWRRRRRAAHITNNGPVGPSSKHRPALALELSVHGKPLMSKSTSGNGQYLWRVTHQSFSTKGDLITASRFAWKPKHPCMVFAKWNTSNSSVISDFMSDKKQASGLMVPSGHISCMSSNRHGCSCSHPAARQHQA